MNLAALVAKGIAIVNTGPATSASLHEIPHRLPLNELHAAHGARMEPFAGWCMPIHYADGILAEHRHTRTFAGLFDVSHMGQIAVTARSGATADAARALEELVPVDLVSLRPGRQRYAFFTNAAGGIGDDLMIANSGASLFLVVNASRIDADLALLRERLQDRCDVELLSHRALLSIQGPAACDALSVLAPAAAAMRFMDAGEIKVDGVACFVSRSGYTGEDGFEISVPAERAAALVQRLLDDAVVKLIGLGARDSLRLEAGLCLYGHDLTADTTPVEAALEWAIQPVRRSNGARSGGFAGSEVILAQLERGAPRRRVGLQPEGRPVREGAPLYADAQSSAVLGRVTSGTYAPSARCPVAMGYVPMSHARSGARLFADVRGQRVPVVVSDLPFVPHRYRRH
jgi:aminomethyltransferase